MNAQERELLTGFLHQLQQANANPKDAEAQALIRAAITKCPDADYLLVQRAVGMNLALAAAQAEIAKLQAERDQARPVTGTGFLGNSASWGRSTAASNSPEPALRPAQAADPRISRAAGTPAAQPSAWGSGMLTTLATTAVGVVAGSFLYQGIQNMMGNRAAESALAKNSAEPFTDEEIAESLDEPQDSLAADDSGSDFSDMA